MRSQALQATSRSLERCDDSSSRGGEATPAASRWALEFAGRASINLWLVQVSPLRSLPDRSLKCYRNAGSATRSKHPNLWLIITYFGQRPGKTGEGSPTITKISLARCWRSSSAWMVISKQALKYFTNSHNRPEAFHWSKYWELKMSWQIKKKMTLIAPLSIYIPSW